MFCSDYMFHFLFASELVSTIVGLHLLFRSNLQNLCQWRIFFSKIRMIKLLFSSITPPIFKMPFEYHFSKKTVF